MSGMTYLSGFGEKVAVNGYIWYIDGPKENIIVDTGGKAETKKAKSSGCPLPRA